MRSVLGGWFGRYGSTACVSALLHAGIFVLPRGSNDEGRQHFGAGGNSDNYAHAPMVMLSVESTETSGEESQEVHSSTAVFQEQQRNYEAVPEPWTPNSIDYSYLSISTEPSATAFVIAMPTGIGSAQGALSGTETWLKTAGRKGGNRARGMGGVAVFMPQPPYPAKALRESREGDVGLNLVVETDGHVVSADIDQASGSPDLDEAARETILHQWRFAKAQAPWRTRVLVHFDLRHPGTNSPENSH